MRAIFVLLVVAAGLQAQTSISCTAVGYCGNSQTVNGSSSGNNNIVTGLPFVFNAAYNLVDAKIAIGSNYTGTVLVQWIADANLTGATINGTVVCHGSVTNPPASAAVVVPLPGCPSMATGKRYWLMLNNNTSAFNYGMPSQGTVAYYRASTCCTAQTTIAGALQADALYNVGIDIGCACGGTVTNTLTWNTAAGVTWNVYRADVSCTSATLFSRVATGLAAPTYKDLHIPAGARCYKVTANNAGGESGFSNLAGT